MSLVVSKKSRRTLDALAASIRNCEQQAAKKRIARDRLLEQAREASLEVASLTEQAGGLREILGGLDKEAYEQAFGEAFTGDEITGQVEPSREQLLAGLRDVLAFLEASPEIPVSHQYWGIDLPRYESDAERIAAVDAIAVILGEEPKRSRYYSGDGREQYGVKRMFGPVRLYADVVVTREQSTEPETKADDQAALAETESDGLSGGGLLDDRMLGMGGGGPEARETDAVVDAYLDGQSELDQALVQEELDRQAEAKASGQCGAKAVTAEGEIGWCRLNAGHDDPHAAAFTKRLAVGHFDPSFGFWNGQTVRRDSHIQSDDGQRVCAHCGVPLPDSDYCLSRSIDAAIAAEKLDASAVAE